MGLGLGLGLGVGVGVGVEFGSGFGLDEAVGALVDVARLLGVGLVDDNSLVVLLELDLPFLAWLGLGIGLGLGLGLGSGLGSGLASYR